MSEAKVIALVPREKKETEQNGKEVPNVADNSKRNEELGRKMALDRARRNASVLASYNIGTRRPS